jgi:hypothetical protein
MKIMRSCASRRIPAATAAVALAATLALDANALDLQFSQTTGFYGGDGVGKATQGQLLGGPSVAGRGGLEFSTAVTGAPGAPRPCRFSSSLLDACPLSGGQARRYSRAASSSSRL